MPSFNKVMLIGNLTRDPQHKTLPSDTILVEFGLAMNRKYRTAAGEDREDVVFVDCTAFGKVAEVIHQYCTKGKPLFVEGRLKFDTWEGKDGSKRSKLSVVVENFQFLPDGKRDQSDPGGNPDPREPASRPRAPSRPGPRDAPAGQYPRSAAGEKPPAEPPYGDEKMFEEDSIPF